MRDANAREGASLSVLTIEVRVPDDGSPDWPEVDFLVDGVDPFAAELPTWLGFLAEDVLARPSPLLPVDGGRRLGLRRCSCGEAGCGVVGAVVVPSPDGQRVSWVDHREHPGVFGRGPVPVPGDHGEGRPWPFPDVHFHRQQYETEVERASADRSWETPRRRTARLVSERLRQLRLVLPPDLSLRWVAPAWQEAGTVLCFGRVPTMPVEFSPASLLLLQSPLDDPDQAADDITRQLQPSTRDRGGHLRLGAG